MSYTIIENAINPAILRAADAAWPRPDWPGWHLYDGEHGRKRATKDVTRLPAACWEALRQLACSNVVAEFNVPGLFPDLDCHGAGLHVIPPGGWLGCHLDSDHHPITGWKRELSGVLFLSSVEGGELAIGEKRIAPLFNRLVLFRTKDECWHHVDRVYGHRERRTLSMFWWSLQPSEHKRPTARFAVHHPDGP